MISRRTFIVAGTAGGAALAIAWWLRGGPGRPRTSVEPTLAGLDPEAPTIVAAIVPAMLAGALPTGEEARQTSIRETVAGVEHAIAGLNPYAQQELAQLFSLLAFAPARVALTGVSAPWAEASEDAVTAFLERWRTSSFALLRSAYDALHQLICAAWYGNPKTWPAIGYPGPPDI